MGQFEFPRRGGLVIAGTLRHRKAHNACRPGWVLRNGRGLVPFSGFPVPLPAGFAPCLVFVAHLRLAMVFALLCVIPACGRGGGLVIRAPAKESV